ncbi:MAG: DUF1269 domain-containing protein [Caldilineaceae bacterium]|nr:DUF1269 domain-containing protein [Caldilineaceae bacterium]
MAGNIHVVMFDDIMGAENMLANVNTWQQNGWLNVDDAVVVTRGSGSESTPTAFASANAERPVIVPGAMGTSEIEIKQTVKRGGKFALGGGGIGLLAGLLLGGPIGGLVVGATLGAITGALKDFGIDDSMINDISQGLEPGTSALFLMTSGGDEEKVLAELRAHKATLLKTTLPPEQERRLREALGKSG